MRSRLPHPEIFASTAPGHRLLIDDGRLSLKVTGFDGDAIVADVVVGGTISNRKGVNVPDAVLDLTPLTDKDRADLEFGLKLGIDWLALSFVQQPSDIMEARQIVGDKAGIMAKIEKPAALDRIDDIVALCDAIMVARGDLGVEIPPEQVPGTPERTDPRLPSRRQTRRRRHPDARFHGQRAGADPRRSLRRRHRDL